MRLFSSSRFSITLMNWLRLVVFSLVSIVTLGCILPACSDTNNVQTAMADGAIGPDQQTDLLIVPDGYALVTGVVAPGETIEDAEKGQAQVFAMGQQQSAALSESDGSFSLLVDVKLENSVLFQLRERLRSVASVILPSSQDALLRSEAEGKPFAIIVHSDSRRSGLKLDTMKFTSGQKYALNEIGIEKVGSISGMVTLENETDFTGTDVYIPGTSYSAKSDALGNYSIMNVPPGVFPQIRAEKDGYHYAVLSDIQVKSGTDSIMASMHLLLSHGATGTILPIEQDQFFESKTVTFTVVASENAKLMMVSENEGFSGSQWQSVQSTVEYTFSDYGDQSLYIKFADANGLESSVFSYDIVLVGQIFPVITGKSQLLENQHSDIEISLSDNPGYNRTLNMLVSDESRLKISGDEVSFNPDNYNQPQIFRMTALSDEDVTTNLVYITISGGGVESKEFGVTLVDIDKMSLAMDAPTLLKESEKADIALYLSHQPDESINIRLSANNDKAIKIHSTMATFTPDNFQTKQFINIEALIDANSDSEKVTIVAEAEGVESVSHEVTTIDKDLAIVLTGSDKVREESTAIVNVFLSGKPETAKKIFMESSNESILVLSPSVLDFSLENYSQSQTVTLSGIKDADQDDNQATISASNATLSSVTKQIIVQDNDIIADTTAPSIKHISPAADSVILPLNVVVVIDFSEAVAAESVNSTTVMIKQGNDIIATSLDHQATKIIMTPEVNLSANKLYTIVVNSGVSDLSGNGLAVPYSSSFTTGSVSDLEAPTVLAVYPPDGAQDIELNRQVMITFSEKVNPLTVSHQSIYLSHNNENVGGSLFHKGETVIFAPEKTLIADSEYILTLSADISDFAANTLGQVQTSTFSTSDIFDEDAPEVTATNLLTDSQNIAIDDVITVTFNDIIDLSSLNSSTFTVRKDQETVIGNISVNGNVAIFVPTMPLEYQSNYQVIITSNVKDISGNSLGADQNWDFTTEAAPDISPPVLAIVSPNYDQTGVSISSQIQASFSEPIDPLSVSSQNFLLFAGVTQISGSVLCIDNVIIFKPDVALSYSTGYTAAIVNALDLSGNPIENQINWKFTTEVQPDNVAPEVLSVIPSQGSVNVSIAVNPEIIFSESMLSSSINSANVFLKQGNNILSGSVQYTSEKAIFTPNETLQFNTEYIMTVSGSVTDQLENSMSEDFIFSFTTSEEPIAIISGIPSNPDNTASTGFVVTGSDVVAYIYNLDSNGWSAEKLISENISYQNLIEGGHELLLLAKNSNNDWQRLENATSYSWTVDTTAPEVSLSDLPADPTNLTSLDISLTGDGVVSYQYNLDGMGYGAETEVTSAIQVSGLAEGNHTLEVIGKDMAGNWQAVENATSYSWSVDVTPGTAVLGNLPSPITNSQQIQIEVSGEGVSTYKFNLNNGGYSSEFPVTTVIEVSGLAETQHNLEVIAKDESGNWQAIGSATSYSWTVDTTAPEVSLSGLPADPTNMTSIDISLSGDTVVSYRYNLDGIGYGAETEITNAIQISGLAEGNHTLEVIGKDTAGNWQAVGSATSYSWTVDTTGPEISLSGLPADPTNLTSINISLSGDGVVSYRYNLDGLGYGVETDIDSAIQVSGLAEGQHSLEVIGKDTVGNWQALENATSYSWSVDITPGTAVLGNLPSPITNSQQIQIEVSGEGVLAYKFNLNNSGYSSEFPVTTAIEVSGLAETQHNIEVIGKDEIGNWQAVGSATSYSWTVDTTAPIAELSGMPASITNSTQATLHVAGEGVQIYRYRLDYGIWSTEISKVTSIQLLNLAEGNHTLEVIGKDTAGNWQAVGSATSYSWTVDTTAPEVSLSGLPTDPTNLTSIDISLTGDGVVSYQYNLDGLGYGAETDIASAIQVSGLAEGNHTLEVIGKDTAGNWQAVGTATSYSWIVDTTAPEVSLSGLPTDPTNLTSIDISLTGDGVVSYQYNLDGLGYGAETDIASAIQVSGLAEGNHTLEVIGKDTAGNWQAVGSATSYSWTVDLQPPVAILSQTPTNPSPYTASFTNISVSGDDVVAYKYRINSGEFSFENSLGTPIAETDLVPNSYTIEVIAKDTAGNWQAEAEATSHEWTILPEQYGDGSDGHIRVISGNSVNIRQLYEDDNVNGAETYRGLNKGLNHGSGNYSPMVGKYIQALSMTIETSATIVVDHYGTGTTENDYRRGVVWIASLGSVVNNGSINVSQKGYNGGAGGWIYNGYNGFGGSPGQGPGAGGVGHVGAGGNAGAGGSGGPANASVTGIAVSDPANWSYLYGSGGGGGGGGGASSGYFAAHHYGWDGSPGGGYVRIVAYTLETAGGLITADGGPGGRGGDTSGDPCTCHAGGGGAGASGHKNSAGSGANGNPGGDSQTYRYTNGGGGGGGASGGSIYLESWLGAQLGTNRLSASGGAGGIGGQPTASAGSVGYIVIKGSYTGSTASPALDSYIE